MSRVSSFILILVIVVVTVGLSRGWFSVWSGRQPDGNRVNVNLTIDPNKMKQDVDSVKDKAEDLIGTTHHTSTTNPTSTAPDSTTSPNTTTITTPPSTVTSPSRIDDNATRPN